VRTAALFLETQSSNYCRDVEPSSIIELRRCFWKLNPIDFHVTLLTRAFHSEIPRDRNWAPHLVASIRLTTTGIVDTQEQFDFDRFLALTVLRTADATIGTSFRLAAFLRPPEHPD